MEESKSKWRIREFREVGLEEIKRKAGIGWLNKIKINLKLPKMKIKLISNRIRKSKNKH